MSAASNSLEDSIIAHLFRTSSWTKPSALYIALYTAAPGETGGGTEVTGGSYARVQRDPLDANWAATAGGNGQTSNSADITFPAPTANWGTCTHTAIHTTSGTDTVQVYGALTNSRIVNNGDAAPKFSTGAFVVTVA